MSSERGDRGERREAGASGEIRRCLLQRVVGGSGCRCSSEFDGDVAVFGGATGSRRRSSAMRGRTGTEHGTAARFGKRRGRRDRRRWLEAARLVGSGELGSREADGGGLGDDGGVQAARRARTGRSSGASGGEGCCRELWLERRRRTARGKAGGGVKERASSTMKVQAWRPKVGRWRRVGEEGGGGEGGGVVLGDEEAVEGGECGVAVVGDSGGLRRRRRSSG